MDSSHEPAHEPSPAEEKKTNRRPANTAFRQQRLKAWQPILTPKNVIWIFLVLGAFTAIVGGLLIYASRLITFIELDYTDCATQASTDSPSPMPMNLVKAEWQVNGTKNPPSWMRIENTTVKYGNQEVAGHTNCTLQFEIPKNISAPVRFYYRLDNFYQNHRRYVNSFFPDQLLDHSFTTSALENSNCAPLAVRNITDANNNTKMFQIYPCGLIANSLFNDTIGRPKRVGGTDTGFYEWNEHGIAWAADFDLYSPLKNPNFDLIAPPPDWDKRYPGARYTPDNPPPNLKTDEHFITWMRTAALPSFYKPWAFGNETLVAGVYTVNIVDSFRMTEFKGRKSFVITTTGPLGGRNDIPGILWLALSGFFFATTILFIIGNWVRPRKLGDHTLLSWNKEPPSAAAKGKGKAPAGPTMGMTTARDL
ncbi:CDC50 family protein [Xylaria sp. CBS 124048]|nr:CDC50 family protein [Xylaria sp. CBS 124048]